MNAADPSSNWVYQMTTQQRPDYLLFRASSDGGRTWRARDTSAATAYACRFNTIRRSRLPTRGLIYAVCLDGFRPGVAFTRSRDHGRLWSTTVRLDGTLRYSDKPTLAVSPSGKDVYVSFNSFNALYVAMSHDYGESWTAPVKATTAREWYYSYGGAVAPNGSIWFAVDGETGPDETRSGHVGLVTSSDGGATWREIPFAGTHEGAPCRVKHCYPDFYTGQDAVAADRRGNLVFVFAKNQRKQGPNAFLSAHQRMAARRGAGRPKLMRRETPRAPPSLRGRTPAIFASFGKTTATATMHGTPGTRAVLTRARRGATPFGSRIAAAVRRISTAPVTIFLSATISI